MNPERATVAETTRLLGFGSTTTIYRYIRQTRGQSPDPLGLDETTAGTTLDVAKTRAYAQTRRNGRPPQWNGAGK